METKINKITYKEKEYEVRELKGQDLFLFMQIADKLNVTEEIINKHAGKISWMTKEEFAKKEKVTGKELENQYTRYMDGKQGNLIGLGVVTYLIKKSHLAKNELNELIASAWGLSIEEVKDLPIKEYAICLKGAIQPKAVAEAFKTFFQLESQK